MDYIYKHNTLYEASVIIDKPPPRGLTNDNTTSLMCYCMLTTTLLWAVTLSRVMALLRVVNQHYNNTKQFVRSPGADPQRLHRGSVTKTAWDVEQIGMAMGTDGKAQIHSGAATSSTRMEGAAVLNLATKREFLIAYLIARILMCAIDGELVRIPANPTHIPNSSHSYPVNNLTPTVICVPLPEEPVKVSQGDERKLLDKKVLSESRTRSRGGGWRYFVGVNRRGLGYLDNRDLTLDTVFGDVILKPSEEQSSGDTHVTCHLVDT